MQISYRLEGAELQEAMSASGSAVLRFVMNTRRLMYLGVGVALCILAVVRVVQHAQSPDAFLDWRWTALDRAIYAVAEGCG